MGGVTPKIAMSYKNAYSNDISDNTYHVRALFRVKYSEEHLGTEIMMNCASL